MNEQKHFFTPNKENTRFCDRCGKYFTDKIHVRNVENEVIKLNKDDR